MNRIKPASLKRMLVNRVIAIAVISIVITGGLALLLYLNNLNEFKDFALRQQINDFIPGLFDIGILVTFALLLTIGLVFLLLGRTLQNINELEEKHLGNDLDDWSEENGSNNSSHDDNSFYHKSEYIPEQPQQTSTDQNQIKSELEFERQLNNLMFSLLNSGNADLEKNLETVLNALGAYCKCDFAAIYKRAENSENYVKIGAWDSEPEWARHSGKIDAVELPLYKWMHKTVKSGIAFTFRAAMLDSMMESIRNSAEDVKAWMRMQAQESYEHKLARHEGWEHFICFPCLEAGEVAGLFLVGYQKADLPISNEEIDRLASIAGALGSKVYNLSAESGVVASPIDIQALVNNLDDAVFLTDIDGKITMLNQAAQQLIGCKNNAVAGKDWNEVFPMLESSSGLPVQDPVIKIYRDFTGNIYLKDVILSVFGGKELQIEGIVAPIRSKGSEVVGTIFLVRDITEKQRKINARIETEKMEAVSSLSSGFAHDFNNILTAILGNISLALDDVPPDSETASFLKAAEESTLKGKTITDNLLAMAKSSPLTEVNTKALNTLEPLVNKMVSGTDVKPVFLLQNKLPEIKMAADIFEKIIRSIVSNSLQAMSKGGVLTVSAREFLAAGDSGLPLAPGRYICIRIKDTGEGIAPEHQSRIFVPYFTTKKGASGLGLTIAYSLLKKHKGYIRLQSAPGKGTDCEIYIPMAEASCIIQTEHKPAAASNMPLALVLDEDDTLGNLLIKTMVKMGLRVQKTTDPEELSTLFFKAQNNGSQVNLILADLNLPSHSDIQTLLQVFKKADPKVRLIAYSNLLELTELDDYRRKGFDDILQKPFNISDLKAVVQRNVSV
ncbi:MAG: ATP-binding protein [Candidatus Cloacimonadaceae bacterium]